MCREIKTIYKAKTKIWSLHDARANCFPNTIIFLKISESPIYGSRSRQTIMLKVSIFQLFELSSFTPESLSAITPVVTSFLRHSPSRSRGLPEPAHSTFSVREILVPANWRYQRAAMFYRHVCKNKLVNSKYCV